MYYEKLLSAVNSIFNPSCNILYRPINKVYSDAYYLAKGIGIGQFKAYTVTLDKDANEADIKFKIKSYCPKVLIIKSDKNIPNDIICIDNTLVFLCFIDENISDNDFDPTDRVRILYKLYKFIIENTKPIIDENTIIGKALSYLPEYLTITTCYLCFSGLDYRYFKDGIESNTLTQRKFTTILDTNESSIMNYSYIYAVMHD